MKPGIVIWAYIGLCAIFMNNMPGVAAYFFHVHENFPTLSFGIGIGTIAAIFGMVEKTAWARMAAFGVVVVEVLSQLGMGIYLQRMMQDEVGNGILISSLAYSAVFSVLAYKLYSSEELDTYLSRQE